MFVPLDVLYNFLDQFINNDTLIYRFYPHGSKKLSDISMLRHYPRLQGWRSTLESIPMIMHDQEPLNFDLYDNIDTDEIRLLLKKTHPVFNNLEKYGLVDHIINMCSDKNLYATVYGGFLTNKWLLCHSEKNSKELVKYESLDAVGVYWWSHAMIARDWYRYACLDKRLDYSCQDFTKDFNVYNRAWQGTREYRLKFAEMVIQHNLLPCVSISMAEYDNGSCYQSHIFKNHKFVIDTDLSILKSNQNDSSASAMYCYEDYVQSAIDVVLETLFDDTRLHLTEKILRPIACGKPFILVSTPGSLAYLRDYGFKTFGEYIDESYDNISDPLDRLKSIVSLMENISNASKRQKIDLYRQLHLIAEQNKKWFWSDEFAQKIIEEFQENYQKSHARCKESQDGRKWLDYKRELSMLSHDYRKDFTRNNEIRSRQDMVKLLIDLKQRRTT